MSFAYLFLDREFPDFNFSATWDPDLRPGGGPSQLKLIQMVHGARLGERGAAAGFIETMYWTLRLESFECFQRVHGPCSISYRDWFYAKLSQFLDLLVYEQLAVAGPGGTTGLKAGAPWEEGFLVLGPGELAVDTVYRMARLRELPSVKVGRALRFDLVALERYVEQHTIETID